MHAYEAEPRAAEKIFGQKIDAARLFTHNLALAGEQRGLIGPLELARIWTRHIINSALVAPLLASGRVADVGSGAGLPGLVLAIARPDVEFVLIEPMERRVTWLTEQVTELGLDNVKVERARAEEVKTSLTVDQVTARAVSALRTLLPLTAPLLRDGGELVLMKGAGVQEEIAAAGKELRKFMVSDVRVIELGAEYGLEITRVLMGKVRVPAT